MFVFIIVCDFAFTSSFFGFISNSIPLCPEDADTFCPLTVTTVKYAPSKTLLSLRDLRSVNASAEVVVFVCPYPFLFFFVKIVPTRHLLTEKTTNDFSCLAIRLVFPLILHPRDLHNSLYLHFLLAPNLIHTCPSNL